MVAQGGSQPSTLERDAGADDEGVDHGLMVRSETRADSSRVSPSGPDAAAAGRTAPVAVGKGSMKDAIVSQLRQEIASLQLLLSAKLAGQPA